MAKNEIYDVGDITDARSISVGTSFVEPLRRGGQVYTVVAKYRDGLIGRIYEESSSLYDRIFTYDHYFKDPNSTPKVGDKVVWSTNWLMGEDVYVHYGIVDEGVSGSNFRVRKCETKPSECGMPGLHSVSTDVNWDSDTGETSIAYIDASMNCFINGYVGGSSVVAMSVRPYREL